MHIEPQGPAPEGDALLEFVTNGSSCWATTTYKVRSNEHFT